MCQGPQTTTPHAAASHSARRRGQQSHKLVNRKLLVGVADDKCADGAKIPKNLKIAMATEAGPSATRAKEHARSERMSSLSLQQMSKAILARPTQRTDARSTVLESTISVANVGSLLVDRSATEIERTASATDNEEDKNILPNVTSTVLESTISVEMLLLEYLKASDGALSRSATTADECQPESDLHGGSSAHYSSPMSVGRCLSSTTGVSDVVEKHSRRRVQFNEDSCMVYEITPYAEIYGLHPREFVFGKDYCILPASKFARVMDEEDSDSDEDEEFDASEWEEEYLIF